MSVQWFFIMCNSSAFTCKSQRSEVSSVYNNCHITEVPFWLQAAPLVLLWAQLGLLTCRLRTLWLLQHVLRHQRATAHTSIPTTYHLFIHFKAFTSVNRTLILWASVQLWRHEVLRGFRRFQKLYLTLKAPAQTFKTICSHKSKT